VKPRLETASQITIMLTVAGIAGAASFTHVHDWTMANSPAGTPGWFGWANAVISELTPLAAGLEIRRRRRLNQASRYPVLVLAAAVALSLAAQVAQAKPGFSGWLLASVPALAFLALSKLVLSDQTASTEDPRDLVEPQENLAAPSEVAAHTTVAPKVAIGVPHVQPGVIPPMGVIRPASHVNGSEVFAR
jgi:hypothetical protein